MLYLDIKKYIYYFAFFVVFGVAGLVGYGVSEGFFSGASPEQPIPFSHRIHAGDNQIPCQYCHIYAERSRVAGVPNVKRCMGCHSIIKTDSPHIQKLTSYWEKKEPIPWVKVHNLPDHVYFPHKRHIKAGLQCAQCHGEVPGMDVITRVSSLQMGWCLNCHVKNNVKNGKDCWTCHI